MRQVHPSTVHNIKSVLSPERPRASVKYHIREQNINKRCPIIYSQKQIARLRVHSALHIALAIKALTFFVCVQKWAIKYDIKAREGREMKTLKASNSNSISLDYNECVFGHSEEKSVEFHANITPWEQTHSLSHVIRGNTLSWDQETRWNPIKSNERGI